MIQVSCECSKPLSYTGLATDISQPLAFKDHNTILGFLTVYDLSNPLLLCISQHMDILSYFPGHQFLEWFGIDTLPLVKLGR